MQYATGAPMTSPSRRARDRAAGPRRRENIDKIIAIIPRLSARLTNGQPNLTRRIFSCYQTHMAKPKPAQTTSDRAQAAIASALRTLEAEGSGVDALAAALRDGLGTTFAAAVDTNPRRARPGDRDRHGQIRSRRAQNRFDFRIDRNACLFRSSRAKPATAIWE